MIRARRRERKSFCPVFERLHPQFAEPSPEFRGQASNTESDIELENISSNISQPKMISESGDETVFENDKENMPIYANINDEIDAKETDVEQTKQIALDLQDRFVWDLCLAIKQDLCQKHKHSKAAEEAIAKLGIRDLVAKFQNDPVDPVEWKDWIMEQYQSVENI